MQEAAKLRAQLSLDDYSVDQSNTMNNSVKFNGTEGRSIDIGNGDHSDDEKSNSEEGKFPLCVDLTELVPFRERKTVRQRC